MTSEQWHRVTGAFHAALAREPSARPAFLAEACAGDTAIRAEIERLLAAHDAAGRFGEAPLVALATAAAGDEFAAPSDAAAVPGRPHPFLYVVAVTGVVVLAIFAAAAWRVAHDAGTVRLAYFVSTLTWCLIGLWIGGARPQNPVARLAMAVSLAVGLLFLGIGVFETPPRYGPLHVVLGYHFFARFPAGAPVRGGWRVTLWALYLTGGAAVASGFAYELLIAEPALLRAREVLANVGFSGAVVAMIAVIVRNYRRLVTEDQRRRVRWVLWAAAVGLAPQLWWAAVALFETFIGPAPVSRLTLLANTAPVAIPIAVAYAVVRYQVLDIRVVVRRTVQYLLARRVLQAAVALPVIGLAYSIASHRNLTIAQLLGETRGYLFWLAVTAFALGGRRPLARALDRRFFREQFDREQLLLATLDDVRRADSIAELAHVMSDRLRAALHPTCAYVWFRDPDEHAAATTSDPHLTPPDVPADGRWQAWVEQRGEAVAFPFAPEARLDRRESRWFDERGVRLVVPLIDAADRMTGALLLGAKRSEEPYTPGDAGLLGAIARQAAVVRENLRLRARVGEDARVRRDVLARLDRRMPDLLRECPACGACYDAALDDCPLDGRALALTLPVARTIDGRYRLDRLLGRGGMGAVYEARDLRVDRTVAVKVLLGREFGRLAALRRFRREARAAARLGHPAIVTLHDYGTLEGDGAFLVMERVRGVTLRDELARRRTLPPADAADWFDPILAGLAAAHDAGLVHRDLKPENVMGCRDAAGALVVKILDLGLVKFAASDASASASMTAAGVIMGTPGYMAPEQLLGRGVDARADLFAAGIMLIETLTGNRPAYATVVRGTAHVRGLAGFDGPAADTLARVVERCVAHEPEQRFASAQELRAALIPRLRSHAPLPVGDDV